MNGTEMALIEPKVEVVAKASQRWFTVAYKRKIAQEADGCKTGRRRGRFFAKSESRRLSLWPALGVVGAPLQREV